MTDRTRLPLPEPFPAGYIAQTEYFYTADQMRDYSDAENAALRASLDDLREFHDAAMVEAGRLLGMESPEEEPRFKWVALNITSVVRERDALRDLVDMQRAALAAESISADEMREQVRVLREALISFTKSAYIKKQHPKRYAAAVAALEATR